MPALEAMQCILPALLCTAVHCSCNELSMYFSDARPPHVVRHFMVPSMKVAAVTESLADLLLSVSLSERRGSSQ